MPQRLCGLRALRRGAAGTAPVRGVPVREGQDALSAQRPVVPHEAYRGRGLRLRGPEGKGPRGDVRRAPRREPRRDADDRLAPEAVGLLLAGRGDARRRAPAQSDIHAQGQELPVLHAAVGAAAHGGEGVLRGKGRALFRVAGVLRVLPDLPGAVLRGGLRVRQRERRRRRGGGRARRAVFGRGLSGRVERVLQGVLGHRIAVLCGAVGHLTVRGRGGRPAAVRGRPRGAPARVAHHEPVRDLLPRVEAHAHENRFTRVRDAEHCGSRDANCGDRRLSCSISLRGHQVGARPCRAGLQLYLLVCDVVFRGHRHWHDVLRHC